MPSVVYHGLSTKFFPIVHCHTVRCCGTLVECWINRWAYRINGWLIRPARYYEGCCPHCGTKYVISHRRTDAH